MLELFPHGFEERDEADGVELAAYTDGAGEERLWKAFGGATGTDVAAGWEERWRDFHRPVRIGELWVGPPWETPPAGAIAVSIDPGRAFGTGGHATTRLCLELVLELGRGSLVDVGCGSGVIAIAAAKVGFAPVSALDVDPVAVETTRRNAAENGAAVEALLADATDGGLPAAAVAVANIALEPIERLAPLLDCRLLVASGYLESERPRVSGFEPVERRAAEGWAADLFERATQ